MTKILVVGCSITYGKGLADGSADTKLWVDQLLNNVFNYPKITNLAVTGKNNNWIFTETAIALTKDHYDIVIIGWSALGRYNYQVGLELYPTDTMLVDKDININPGITFTGKWLEKIGNNLRKIHHDHWSILELIKYVNILYELQIVNRNAKLFFVNTLSTFPETFFIHQDFTVPSELDSYTQNMLNVDTRDNTEIKDLYNLIHDQYNFYGGIKPEYWLNLHNSLMYMKIDDASATDKHPGYQSQDIFANYLIPILKEKLQ
jgi:hypothetical protein